MKNEFELKYKVVFSLKSHSTEEDVENLFNKLKYMTLPVDLVRISSSVVEFHTFNIGAAVELMNYKDDNIIENQSLVKGYFLYKGEQIKDLVSNVNWVNDSIEIGNEISLLKRMEVGLVFPLPRISIFFDKGEVDCFTFLSDINNRTLKDLRKLLHQVFQGCLNKEKFFTNCKEHNFSE